MATCIAVYLPGESLYFPLLLRHHSNNVISKRWVIQRRLPTTHPMIIQIIILSSSFVWLVDGVDVVTVLEVELLLLPEVVAAADEDDVIDIVVDGVAVGITAVNISADFIYKVGYIFGFKFYIYIIMCVYT